MPFALSVYAITYTSAINSMDNEDEEHQQVKVEFRSQSILCNRTNIVISTVGLGSSLSAGFGFFVKNRVLEATGIIGSTVSTALLITANCLACCQYDSNYDGQDL